MMDHEVITPTPLQCDAPRVWDRRRRMYQCVQHCEGNKASADLGDNNLSDNNFDCPSGNLSGAPR